MLTIAMIVTGQTVTTSPAILTPNSTNVVITFHADGGNKGMMGVTKATEVYAHTGVITNKSDGTWTHAADWNKNEAKYKMTWVSDNTWSLTIPNMRTFYGLTDASETIEKLCFVFRTGDRSKEAKTAAGGDVFIPIYPANFPSSKAATFPGGTPRMGTTVNADGSVTFCLGAPSKTNATIVGSWNDYALDPSQVMNYQDYNGFRYFWQTVKGLQAATNYIYYYIVDGCTMVGDPYANLVLDPWNDQYMTASVFPNLPKYPSTKITGVPLAVFNTNMNTYSWKVKNFKGVDQSDLIIYELLLRDFTGTEGQALGNGTVKKAMDKLDYLQSLGVNAIELLPIMEFSGNNSWGYNTNFYMAPDKAYGTPTDYRAFIDACHARGMAVILDIVFNQSDGMHPWYGMYTQVNTPFYNGSAPHDYSVLNDWNQNCEMVQQQWYDALDYWMTAYNVDGFRFDLVKGLGDNNSYGTTYNAATNTYSTPSAANTDRYNPSRIARMKKLHAHVMATKPDAYFINEDLALAPEENEMARDGEINWANINTQSCEYVMGWKTNASLDRFYAPKDGGRLWGSTVSYAESHDEERMAYKGKTYGDTGIKGNTTAATENLYRRLGSLAAQMLLTPGAHMIWQFQEVGADQTTKNTDGSNNTAPKTVIWNALNNALRKGLRDTYADLNAIRAAHPTLFKEETATAVNLSAWTSRTLCLSDGTKELYLLVNPAVSGAVLVPFPTNPKTGAKVDLSTSRYELVAKSYNSEPVISANGVSIPAGAFAVYGASLESGIDDIFQDSQSGIKPEITVENGYISVLTPHTNVSIHNLNGISLPADTQLPAGLYIVTVDDAAPVKVIVR